MEVVVTEKALERYRARFDPIASMATVERVARAAGLAPAWVRKQVALVSPVPWREAMLAGEVVLIVDRTRPGRLYVFTALPLDLFRRGLHAPARGNRQRRRA